MKTQIESQAGLSRKIQISIPGSQVQQSFDKAYKNLQKTVVLKGFRPGKAPISMLKKLYMERASQEAAYELLEKGFAQAIKEHELRIIGEPKFDYSVPVEAQEYSFSVEVELRPEVELKKTDNFNISILPKPVTDEDVKGRIKQLQTQNTKIDKAPEGATISANDIVIAELTPVGPNLDSADAQNTPQSEYVSFHLGMNLYPEEFEKELLGKKINEVFKTTVPWPLPKVRAEWGQKEGRKDQLVDFKVTAIYHTIVPEFTDEFVKERFGLDSLQILKERIKEDLVADAEEATQRELREKLFQALMAANPVELPQNFVARQKEKMIDDLAERFQRENLSEKDFSEYVQKWDQEIEKNARESVHLGFLVDAMAAKFNLYATAAEVESYINGLIQQYQGQDPKVAEKVKTREFAEEAYFRITENKVFEYLKTH